MTEDEKVRSRRTAAHSTPVSSTAWVAGIPPTLGGGAGFGARLVSACEHLREVPVAAAGQADEDELRVQLPRAGEGVRGLQRRHDAFRSRRPPERGQRLLVPCADRLRTA